MKLVRPTSIGAGLTLVTTNAPEAPPAAYSSGTTYAEGAQVSVLQGDGFTLRVYRSLGNANAGNPVTDGNWWQYLADTYAAYDAGATYGAGYRVVSTITHRQYESVAAGNLGHGLDEPAWWIDLGPTNPYAMFDQANSTQTGVAGAVEFEVSVAGRADAIALLNLVAANVDIEMSTAADGVVFSQSINLVSDSGVTDWYQYYFEPIVRKGDLVVYGLPNYANPTFKVVVHEPASTAKVGVTIVGQSRELGELLPGAKTGIMDFSRKETDDFGNFTIVQRAYAKRGSYKVLMDNARIDSVSALLATYRAEAILWLGLDRYTSTWVYGFYRDYNVEIFDYSQSYLTLELEGLT
ncbi:hypothetical protein [Novosphingobium kaempferiae]|uniref:hypothetical protein n=1 Tax=Novosphingobium kaempferiae TaxID=2896849 RepID=UPI001E2DAE19|nr:hypothetical protein [Novosphingobium kaempferiae]